MPAFEDAVRLGYRYVETDVHVTADGVLLAFHDDVLDRVTDHSGDIAKLPWDVVRQAQGRRPRADPAARGPARHVSRPSHQHRPEARRRGAAPDRRHREVRRRRPSLHRLVLRQAGRTRCARRWARRSARRSVRRGCGVSSSRPRGFPAGRFHQPCAQVPTHSGSVTIVNQRFVDAAHARGIAVHVWTIDDDHRDGAAARPRRRRDHDRSARGASGGARTTRPMGVLAEPVS